jgi:tRNA (guanine-N7-)-methyltransferase
MSPPVAADSSQSAMELPTLVIRPASYVERLDLAQIYPVRQPLEVELGSGDGSFLAQYAHAHPEHNFLGVERLLGRLRKLDRKGRRASLKNLRLVRLEASYFVEYLLPASSVRALHIYFPDPWPKRRHRPRRLVNARFTEIARAALEPQGVVHLRTDNEDYFAQMTEVFGANPAFEATDIPPALSAIVTDFEREFQAKGIRTLSASYRRRA